MLCFKASASSGFDDFKTDPFATKDPFVNEPSKTDDPFHSHDPFAGTSSYFLLLRTAVIITDVRL